MAIKTLAERPGMEAHEKWTRKLEIFQKLITELARREIPSEITDEINKEVDGLNAFSGTDKAFMSQLAKAQNRIVKLIEEELKLVPRNYYRKLWLILGMSVFGIPIGTAFGVAMGNMGLLGIGLPIGMPIGMAIGSGMDRKAEKEGRQLEVEL